MWNIATSHHKVTDGSYTLWQVVPAEGLVSILKKRNDTVGDHSAQMQQKPSKRRVRFQEIDDTLDQGKLWPRVDSQCFAKEWINVW